LPQADEETPEKKKKKKKKKVEEEEEEEDAIYYDESFAPIDDEAEWIDPAEASSGGISSQR